jgi:hypothetical protein
MWVNEKKLQDPGHPRAMKMFWDLREKKQPLSYDFRLGLDTGIWQIATPIPPRAFAGYFSRAFSAAAFVLNGFDNLSGKPSL